MRAVCLYTHQTLAKNWRSFETAQKGKEFVLKITVLCNKIKVDSNIDLCSYTCRFI